MRRHTLAFAMLLATPLAAQEIVLVPGFRSDFRGLASQGSQIWASGRAGTIARSSDGGGSWKVSTIPGADSLVLVDVEALGRDTACVLATSFGGGVGRAYRTTDGGNSWGVTYELEHPQVFLDGMAFWDHQHGVAFGDPVDGAFFVLRTDDGCASWSEVPAGVLPTPLNGEAGFAASGTAIAAVGTRHAWIGTGGGSVARVLRTEDRGRTWTAVPTTMPGGSATGIFGIAFRDTLVGVAVGGNYQQPDGEAAALLTDDGGRSWRAGGAPVPTGVQYGVVSLPELDVFVSAGPRGLGFSRDLGRTWTPVDTLYAFALHARDGHVWTGGPTGWVARLDLRLLLDRAR